MRSDHSPRLPPASDGDADILWRHTEGLTVTMLGDLKYGRTVHSLARLLSMFKVRINYVSPEILRMPREVMDEVAEKTGIAKGTIYLYFHDKENLFQELIRAELGVNMLELLPPAEVQAVKASTPVSPTTVALIVFFI